MTPAVMSVEPLPARNAPTSKLYGNLPCNHIGYESKQLGGALHSGRTIGVALRAGLSAERTLASDLPPPGRASLTR